LTGEAATQGGTPLFVAFYAMTGTLLAAAAYPMAPDAARTTFGDLPQLAQHSYAEQIRWSAEYLELAQPIIYQGQPVGMAALRLGTEELTAAFYRELVQSTATTLILTVVLSLVIGLLLRQIVIAPLRRLSAASDQISLGDWVSPPGQERADELGTLARSFGQMLSALHAREQQLHEQVAATQQLNAELDARVVKRTEELAKAKEVAEAANHLKTQFLANMSHELRTPLNAILNFTRFLGKERYGPLTPRQLDLQQRVLANGEHLLGLINDILDLAKIEAGRIELLKEAVQLEPILHGVLATISGLTKDKGVKLTLELPAALPLVYVDKTHIRQVLLNLLSNAAKFTERGEISLYAAICDDQQLYVQVKDTGVGIAPEHHALVFEEFRQVQDGMDRMYEGTGLGLPISRRLVEMHGGKLWLESAPGVGSTFMFTLPCTVPSTLIPQASLPHEQESHHVTPT
jgi:signal transduction histidine kinase